MPPVSPVDISRLRSGPSCPVCGSSAIPRSGGALFCVACGPQALEEIAVEAYRHGVIPLEALMSALGMESREVALAFAENEEVLGSADLNPPCPRCGGSAIRRPGGVVFCSACGPRALEEIVVRAYFKGVLTLQGAAEFLGMDQTAAFEFLALMRGQEEE